MAESRVDLPGLIGKPVLLELHWADVSQRRARLGAVVPDQPVDHFVFGMAPGFELLPMYIYAAADHWRAQALSLLAAQAA